MSLSRKFLLGAFSIFLTGLVLVSIMGFVITADIDKSAAVLSPGEEWFDDWYTITAIDDKTFAIGEPRYWQLNYNFLLLGEERAILFDTGPGVRNIKPLVDSLTQLPITVVSSHPHYDHIGNNHLFSHIAWLDIPSIRSEVTGNVFYPSMLRSFSISQTPPFHISEWWQQEQLVELGNRSIQVFHIPGHEEGSVALLDSARKQLFTGDFIYPGWLVAFAPTSDLDKYISSIAYLLQKTGGNETLFGAHAVPEHPSPALPYSALNALEHTLDAIKSNTLKPASRFPFRVYPVNNEMEIYFPPFSTSP